MVEVVLEANAGRVPVVAGVAATTTTEAVRQARALESLGVDGRPGDHGNLFSYSGTRVLSAISLGFAQAVSCPVVLYTNPNFQRGGLTLDVIDRLAAIPNVNYLKDASNQYGAAPVNLEPDWGTASTSLVPQPISHSV